MTSHIPIIDISSFTTSAPIPPTRQQRLATARSLVQACHDVGFVYVKNHGIPDSLLSAAFAHSKSFFDLPVEVKKRVARAEGSDVYRGYSRPGLEKVSNYTAANDDDKGDGSNRAARDALIQKLREVQDFKESYDLGSEESRWQDNIWLPDDLKYDEFIASDFRAFMVEFNLRMFELAKRILLAFALGLGAEYDNVLLDKHSGQNTQMRLLHYPPIPAEAVEGGTFARMPAHSDWSTFTMLFQDDCGGLQVEGEAGHFVDATPLEGTLVLNVGDLLMRWSNDYLKSTQHRVTLPPLQDRFSSDERLTRARYSIPYFVSPDPDVVIECLQLGARASKYEPITQRAYNQMRASMHY